MADKEYKLKLRLSNGNDIDAGTFTVPQGEQGETGKTAYDYAKDGGYAGTEAQFAAKLAEEPPAESDPTVPAWAKEPNPPAESDPTVPDWAKQPNKPTYTADDVGARPNTWTPTPADIGLKTEPWTLTYEDGTTETKVVYVG